MNMKRNLTIERKGILVALTIAVILACPTVFAQSQGNEFGQQFQFGFRGGVSWAELEVESVSSSGTDSRRTITAGAFWAFPVSSRFAIQPEVTLKRYGNSYYVVFSSEDYPDGYASGVWHNNLNYIAVSSMVRFQPLSRGIVLPLFLAGPRIDINFRAQQGFEDDFYSIPNVKRVTLGLDLGGMLVLNLKTPIFIDIRGSIGLTKAYELCGFQFQGTSLEPVCFDVKGNMLSITAGAIIL